MVVVSMPTIKINFEELTFNNVYYADYQNGSDTTGIGTEELPYKTIPKALSMCLVDGDAIFVKGDHAVSANISFNKNVSVIGDYFAYGSKITMSNYRLLDMPLNITVKFYRLYLHQTAGVAEMFDGYIGSGSYKGKTHVYNCILHANTVDLNRPENIYLSEYICKNSIRIYRNTSVNNSYAANAQYTNTATVIGTFPISATNSSKTTCLNTVTIDSNFNILTGGTWENAGTGLNPNGTTANIGIYGGPYAFGDWLNKRYFFFDNGLYKTYNTDTSSWITPIGSNVPAEQDYLDYGMIALTGINYSSLNTLTNKNNITIKQYTELQHNNKLTVVAKPQPQLVLPTNDILIAGVESIKQATLTSSVSGTGRAKVIVSFNSGVDWYGYDTINSEFVLVNYDTDYSDIEAYGITSATLATITEEQWNTLRGDTLDLNNRFIRFGYYLATDNYSDNASIDNITLLVDMKGTWNSTTYDTTYIYAYTNYMLNVKLKQAGTYKINYYFRGPAISTGVDSWNDLLDKPDAFVPIVHEHPISDVVNLQTALNNKADTTHTHDHLHTHIDLSALDLISVDTETNQPLWMGTDWPGNVPEERWIDTFLKQYDTPSTYSGNENKYVKVKADRTGLEFVELHNMPTSTSEITGSQVARRYAILYGRD
jgi:hypothetical protein